VLPERCDDGADNDRDGAVDCADDDCDAWRGCQPVLEYGMPFGSREDCDDGIDNDRDGAIDCRDSDCRCAVALYAAPPCPDIDGDGTPDCQAPPPRPGPAPLYGVPFPR
jgi:hypothetical protein